MLCTKTVESFSVNVGYCSFEVVMRFVNFTVKCATADEPTDGRLGDLADISDISS